MKKTVIILFALFFLLSGASIGVDKKTLEDAGAQALAGKAPDLAMIDSEGRATGMRDLRGNAVILHFWASWCSPCKREFPAIERIYQRFKDSGLTVLAVSIEYGADLTEMKRLASSLGATFPVFAVKHGNGVERYWSLGVPMTYFIDKNGNIAGRFAGEGKWTSAGVEKLIKTMVEE